MATYYVHIPGSEAPTAEVDASSTRHARTAYLDYLSRSGVITWSNRQATRSLVKVNRMQPGEIQTQVKLEYEASKSPEQVVEVPPVPVETTGEVVKEEVEPVNPKQARPYFANSFGGAQVQQQAQPQPRSNPFDSSPIIQLSRKSRGV